MNLSLYTPEKTLLFQQEVKEVIVPSAKGEIGLLPGHAPLITLLQAGVLRYLPEGKTTWEKCAVGWGYLEIFQEEIKILAESAQTKEALDRSQAEKDLKEIEQKLEDWALEPKVRESLEKEKLKLQGELEL